MSAKILNFGSLNIDRVYSVPHIVRPGETLSSSRQADHLGGKGLNQSIALARAGRPVFHAGIIGEDGGLLRQALEDSGVNIKYLKQEEGKSGHTIIQVDAQGQNSIILSAGTNFAITKDYVDQVIANFQAGDVLLIQNEINQLDHIIHQAHKQGMTIVFNPSPFDDGIRTLALDKVTWFFLNEIEAMQITDSQELEEEVILQKLSESYPDANFLITYGSDGSICYSKGEIYRQEIYPSQVLDTTGAGDTFTGYFIASLMNDEGIQKALDLASRASSIAVSREGASPAIPSIDEVNKFTSN